MSDTTDVDDLAQTLADFAPELFVTPADPAPLAAPASDETEDVSMADISPQERAAPEVVPSRVTTFDDETEDAGGFVEDITIERDVPNIIKPWMQFHKFTRVETIEHVRQIVDASIKNGRCSLDTETQGLDNRIEYDAAGKVHTRHQIVGYCISYDGVEGFYIPVLHKPDDGVKCQLNLPLAEVSAEIRRLCMAAQPTPAPEATDPLSFREFAEPPKVIIYFWNAKFDQEMLYPITGIDWWHPESFEDGMLACFCDYSADKSLSLKDKSKDCLRSPKDNHPYEMIKLKDLFTRGRPISFPSLSPDEPGVIRYGCSDAICTYLLCEPPRKHEPHRKDYIKLAKTKYAFTYRLEKQTSQVVRVMERNRARVNRERAHELLEEHKAEFERVYKQIREAASAKGFNLDPSSTQQLSNFLFGDGSGCLNLTPKPEKNELSGQYKTDGETLEGLAEGAHAPPILKWVVEYRGLEKMLGTYLEHLYKNPDKDTDELRFNFKQTGAGTGRFSAPAGEPEQGFSGVPIHGIPSESSMRKLFIAREGYTMVKADYAGQELRIAANESKEPVWINEFLHGDGDLHSITARAFFNKDVVSKDERKMGKIANFALIYGGGPAAIIRATGCDKVEASRRKQAFDKAVPTFAGWIKSQQRAVKKDLGVWTPFKRWLAVPDANHEDRKIQAACERYAVNYPIQGSGADIMKISMVMLHKEFHKRGWLRNGGEDLVRMLLTVHDEIVFEIKHHLVGQVVPVIVETMAMPGKMASKWPIPLIVEPLVGPNWGTGYKCEPHKEGHKLEEGDVVLNGYVYGTIRTVDLGKENPEAGEVEHSRDEAKKKIKIRILDPAWLREVSPPAGSGPGDPQGPPTPRVAPTPAPQTARPAPPPSAAPVTPPASTSRVVTMKIIKMTRDTVVQVFKAVAEAADPDGKLLHITDHAGTLLVDPTDRIMIDPDRLAALLNKTYNLSNGAYTEEK